jgi:L-ascorbate metabolism protein UlaG (beta-lactamase superfamily)
LAVEVTWYGRNCFRLRSREATIICDPVAKEAGFNLGKQQANVVTVSNGEAGYGNVAAVAGEPMVLDAPGEYEVSHVLFSGYEAGGSFPDGPRNVAFRIETEDITFCHLGLLKAPPPAAMIEQLGVVDVLFLPVGGENGLTPAQAVETMNLLEPRITVPMNYAVEGDRGGLLPLSAFLKELGVSDKTPEARLNLTQSGLPGETTVTPLESRG